ncbi:hypothetical protein [Bacillus sp. 1P02SD]|uniref:glucosamine inositolphosphorylceramide transferase family protein n=1 Tax=Bacillus sp. 1P02SD TaxID=3132264 RepID=UPI00399F3A5A
MIIISIVVIIFISIFILIWKRKINIAKWSIKVFNSESFIASPFQDNSINKPTLKASDVTDINAEFVADPFIIKEGSRYYLFFEVLEKSTNKGVIGLATSENGEKWKYEKIVLRETFHLSYPHVFKFNENFYMIPESIEADRILLYKAKNFPHEWEIVHELLRGKYVDPTIFQYKNNWWMFAGTSNKLHLFSSANLEGKWIEHPMSPIITGNNNITRPGGRVIIENGEIYRYAQDGQPYYGFALRAFKIKKLSTSLYEEEEVSINLYGSSKVNDWRKDGMHSIDQLKIEENKWLIAVDGHIFKEGNYIIWKVKNIIAKFNNYRLKALK